MTALDRDVLGTLTTVAPLLDQIGPQLPELISVNVNESGVSIMPWLPGAPLTALLAWAEQLSTVSYEVNRPDEFDTTQVIAHGVLDGLPIHAMAFTHRNVEDVCVSKTDAGPPRLTVGETGLRRAAAYEFPLATIPAEEQGARA